MTPPVPPTPQQALTGAQLNTRIAHGDPAFPKELWGKTLAEAMRFYSIMREDFMRRNNPANQPAPSAAPEQPVPQASQAPRVHQPPVAPQAPAATGGTYDEAAVQRIVQQAVAAAFASSPLAVQAADSTHDRMKREYRDWMTYEADILQTLEGATAEQLANPETWRTAYFFVKGRKLSEANAQQTFDAPAPGTPPTVFGAPNGSPTVTRPPAPPTSNNPTWFTEGPSAPAGNPTAGPDPRNDPRVIAMAARHGIPVDEYVQWLGGNVPSMAAPARVQP